MYDPSEFFSWVIYSSEIKLCAKFGTRFGIAKIVPACDKTDFLSYFGTQWDFVLSVVNIFILSGLLSRKALKSKMNPSFGFSWFSVKVIDSKFGLLQDRFSIFGNMVRLLKCHFGTPTPFLWLNKCIENVKTWMMTGQVWHS